MDRASADGRGCGAVTRPPDGTPDSVLMAEEAVIAACLLDDEAYARVATNVSSGDFYLASNRMMFAGIAHLARENVLVTTITLAHDLAQRDELDRVGGEPAIQEIMGRWFTAIGVEAHAELVKHDSQRRQLFEQAKHMVAAAERGDFAEAQQPGRSPAPDWWKAYEEEA